jgi:hypothetical protein
LWKEETALEMKTIFRELQIVGSISGKKFALGLEFKYGANPVLGVDQVVGGGTRAGRLNGGEWPELLGVCYEITLSKSR